MATSCPHSCYCTCFRKPGDYTNEKVDCCHMYSMILSSSDYDSKNFDLINTYLDLKEKPFPLKKYNFSENVISQEVKQRQTEVMKIYEFIKDEKMYKGRMGELLCRIRNICLGYEKYSTPSCFQPTLDDLYVIKEELKYFGFIWGENLHLAGLFLYDICMSILFKFSKETVKEFMVSYPNMKLINWKNLVKEYISSPPKEVMDDLIKDTINFFKNNK